MWSLCLQEHKSDYSGTFSLIAEILDQPALVDVVSTSSAIDSAATPDFPP